MSGEIHMNENRQTTTSLLGLSENSKHEDVNNYKNTVNDSWNEAVTPWKSIASHPRYFPHQVSYVIKRKQKPLDPRVPDWQRTNVVDGESKQTVRCVNDDLENGPYLHWKGMVEQVTYRYVPHNGYYRTMKFLSFDKREWFTVHKKQPEQVSMSWQSKRYQKELKRQLKKDLETKKEKEAAKREATNIENEEANDRTPIEIEINEISECNTDCSRKRPKSTKSPHMSKRHQIDEDGHLVPSVQSAPLPGDLYKSRSDLYIENITLRISALEREIANDSRLRKHQEDIMVKPLFRPKTKENANVTPRPYKKESLPEDVFAAKGVSTSETLAPISRISNPETNSAPVTHLKYTTSSGNDAATVNLPTIDLEKTLNSYKLAIENTRQSLLTTLNGKQISRRTITGKNYSSPTTITICDSGDGSDKGSVKEYIRPIKGEKRNRDKKESFGVALLPGIAGKRLEVPTTTHRWL